jgi:hypothetical protein
MTVFQLNNLITKWNAELVEAAMGWTVETSRSFTRRERFRSLVGCSRLHDAGRTPLSVSAPSAMQNRDNWPLSRAVRTMLIAEGARMS